MKAESPLLFFFLWVCLATAFLPQHLGHIASKLWTNPQAKHQFFSISSNAQFYTDCVPTAAYAASAPQSPSNHPP